MCKILKKNVKKDNLKYYFTKYPQWGNFDKLELKPLSREGSRQTDSTILNYIKSNPKILIISIWSKYDENCLKMYLSNIGEIYYQKKIFLSKKGMISLFYQLQADSNRYREFGEIEKKIDETYPGWVEVVIFINVKNEFIELIRMSINEMLESRNNLEISHNFTQTIEQAQIYFCENSINFLEQQLLEKFMHPSMRRSRIMLATFRNWYYRTTTLEERERIILFSSSILYTYGIRNMNDIDILIENSDNNLSDNIKKYLIDQEMKFCFIDSKARFTNTWPRHWDVWESTWLGKIGAKDFKNVLEDPKYHYYFLGIKFLCLGGDIVRRAARERPRAMVDLIKIKENLAEYGNITIPRIPNFMKKYIHLEADENPEKYLFSLPDAKYLEKTHEIMYLDKIIREKFLNTMKWYLKKMYYEDLEISEIESKIENRKKIKIKIRKNEPEQPPPPKFCTIRIKKK